MRLLKKTQDIQTYRHTDIQTYRHTDIVSLGRREIDEREFPYWRMGFRNVGDIDTRGLGGYSNFMERDNKAYLEENPGFAHSLLLFFRDNAK